MDQFRGVAPFASVQPPYNLFEREMEDDILPYAERMGLTLLCYGALCRGLLSGKMTISQKFEGDDLRKVDPKFRQPRFAEYLAAADALKTLARQRFGKSLPALAIRWVLDQGPTVALWGARHPGQLEPITEIDGWMIDEQTKSDIDRILKQTVTNPASPAFMAPPVTRPADAELVPADAEIAK